MYLKNFWFSYKNILLNTYVKKRYFSCVRKIFGTVYKYASNYFKKKFSSEIINLDYKSEDLFYSYELDSLFKEFNCDKGSTCIWDGKKVYTHKYSIFYEKYLSNFKKEKINILELGSHEGRALASFFYYFPESNLYGANINPFQMKYTSRRIQELYVDVSSKIILNNLANYLDIKFDVIIDDASHNVKDILLTLPIFFKKLKDGGYYIIEDIDQFKLYKNLNPTNESLTPLKILKNIKNKINFESKFLTKSESQFLFDNIKEYNFEKGSQIVDGHNLSDIVFLKKND